MNFSESESYLFSLGNEVSAMKFGLENIRDLLAALGDPENKYLKVQVAGTNGKGSVCAFLDAICVSAGIQTGLYTSPHLVSITERIKVNRRDISVEDFARNATRVRQTSEDLLANGELECLPTFFEQITAIALVAFAEAEVELAILETGLGGRLDATTAANAEIAAITRIDYDHQNYLGDTIEEIAAEKAAIIHEGSKVVVAEQRPEAAKIVKDRCDLFQIQAESASRVRTTCGNGWLRFETSRDVYELEGLGLRGQHQIDNAKVAILLAETLQEYLQITKENVIDGLQNAHHPGRLEFHGNFLFDGAHNAAGAKALREFLDDNIKQPIVMIFGSMKDKDIVGIAEILFPKADTVILTKPKNPRAMPTEEIAKRIPSATRTILTESVADAITTAKEIAGNDRLILVTGSLYLIGEVKMILGRSFEI